MLPYLSSLPPVENSADEKAFATQSQLTVEENQTNSRKSFTDQIIASIIKIGKVIFGLIQIDDDVEPIITRLKGRDGEDLWEIYNPNTGKTVQCMTDYEVMEWLDRRYW
jgi:hypothetical protein